MISFACPRCNTAYHYADEMAGRKIRCTGPNCRQKLLVPASSLPTVVAPPSAPAAAVRTVPRPVRKPAAPEPPPRAPRRTADGGERGGLFEKIGVGLFAVVAAVILVGLFMILFPLIHSAAAHTSPAPAAAGADDNKNGGDGGKTDSPALAADMKPQEVTALVRPSVALSRTARGPAPASWWTAASSSPTRTWSRSIPSRGWS